MACNTIILGQPAAQESVSYTVPADSAATLDFSSQEIAGIKLNGSNQLVISFENGSQITIDNFQELVGNNNIMYLSDGTVLDPSVLTAKFQSPDNLPKNQVTDIVHVGQPEENTKQELKLSQGNQYICEFDQSNIALIEVANGKMVLTFADGSQVVLHNYSDVMAGELPPELTLADGTVIDPEILLTGVEKLGEEVVAELTEAEGTDSAENVANVEPAAGEEDVLTEDMAALAEQLAAVQPAAGEASSGASSNGYGFNSAPVEVLLESPDAIGPLNPTALNYQAPEANRQAALVDLNDRPVTSTERIDIDETTLSGGTLVATGTLEVDYGNDTPGSIRPNGQFIVVGSALNNNLSSQGVDVEITQTSNGYEGTANGVTVFTFVIAENGDYTYTQLVPFDHADAADHNDAIVINLGITATDVDGDRAQATVSIRIADDAPIILSQIDTNVDESDFAGTALVQNGQFNAEVGEDSNVEAYAANNTFVASGSLLGGVLSSAGHAVTVTLTDNVYTGVANGEIIFTLTLNPETGAYTYEQFVPFDHGDPNDPNDVLTLEFGVTVTDFDGDTADGTITVNVFDDGPSLDNQTEDTTIITTGNIVDDPAVTVTDTTVTDGDISFDQPITSNGVPVTVTLIGDTYVGTADTNTIFEIQILDDGTFVFTQYDEIDQGDVGTPLNITINVEVTDDAGNVTTQPLVIPVDNNFSELSDNANIIKEDPLDTGSVTTQSVIDFGGDGPGSADPTGEFKVSGSLTDWTLTSNGDPVTVELVGNSYIGTANGVEVFTLEINPANGEYTFTLNAPLDHADGSDPNDLIELQFGMLVSDSEGDNVNGYISIFVEDGAPIIHDSSETIQESDLTTGPIIETGNVGANFNADGGGSVTPSGNFVAGGSLDNMLLTSNGVSVVVTQTAGGYVGTAGADTIFTLEIDPTTGEYTFTQYAGLDHADNNSNDSITLTFGVQITDFDGDTNTSNIVITVVDSAPIFQPNNPELNNGLEIVGEGNLESGDIVETGKLEADFGGDGPGTYEGIASQLPTGLTQNGVAITVSFNPSTNTYTAETATGANVFTLVINPVTGDYTYTQVGAIDHPDSGDSNDVVSLEFGVNAVDSEGEATEGSIIINVVDDGPSAEDDNETIREENVLHGNVTDNDDEGSDSVGAQVTEVTFNGVTTVISQNSGTSSITGDYGVLTIDLSGQYTYTPNNNDPDGVDIFTYTLVDGDGDQVTATLNITVTPDFDPIVTNETNSVDETDIPTVFFGPGGVVPQTGVSGTIEVDARGEGPASVTGNGNFSVNGVANLTSNGQPIIVTLNGDGLYLGRVGSEVIFELDVRTDGTYNFRLFGGIDHPDTNDANDSIDLVFGVQATDVDGDSTDATVTITVNDDGPQVNDLSLTVDESDGLPTGSALGIGDGVIFDIGTDGGSFSLVNNVEFTDGNGNPITLDGITITQPSPHTMTGFDANGDVVFTFGISESNDGFGYVQHLPFTHPSIKDANDLIIVNFTAIITDNDGDSAISDIQISVFDDGPVAKDDAVSIREGNVASGNVLDNDDLGADGGAENTIIDARLQSDGAHTMGPGSFPVRNPDGSLTVVGKYGTLTLSQDGSYKYTPRSNDPDGTDIFTYTIEDGDGDQATATLTIEVSPDFDPIVTNDTNIIDETNIGDTVGSNGESTVVQGAVSVDFQGEGPGQISGNGAFSVVGISSLTSNGQPVSVTLSANGTYVGTANSETVFELLITNNGNYEFRLFQGLDHPDTNDVNDSFDLVFGITAQDVDGDTTDGTITISVLDDGPIAYADLNVAYENILAHGNVLDNDDEGSDSVGAQVTEVIFNGVTTVISQNSGTSSITGDYGVLTIDLNGQYTYRPNNNNPQGTDTFTYTLVDGDGDRSSATLTIEVSPDFAPIVTNETNSVDETDIPTVFFGPGGVVPQTGVSGTIEVDARGEGPASVTGNGNFSVNGVANLTSNGQPIIVTLNGDGLYLGRVGSEVIFELDVRTDGTYNFRLFGGIDHPDTNDANDSIDLVFGVQATDVDGDSTDATVTITVNDDGPIAGDITGSVDESDGLPTDIGFRIADRGLFDLGTDGGSVELLNNVEFTNGAGQPISLAGITLVQSDKNSNEYSGVDSNGVAVFTIALSNSGYSYTQHQPFNHPNANDADDSILVNFVAVVTDNDGDTATSNITIEVKDDGPVAVADTALAEEGHVTRGNILNNDTEGADGAQVTYIEWRGGDVRAAGVTRPDGSFEVSGSYGVLIVQTNGAFTYTPYKNNPEGTDLFSYTITDGDGDRSSATLTIEVAPDFAPIIVTARGTTDDSIVDDAGRDVETGTINVDYQGDGAGDMRGNGNFSVGGNLEGGTLSHNGVAVTVNYNSGNNTYTGTAGGKTVFTMTINANGTYRFVQHENLDHSLTNNHNEALALRFGVTAVDGDGDTANGTVVISVRDDGPSVEDSGAILDETDGLLNFSGNIEFDAGADGGVLSIAPADRPIVNENGRPIDIGGITIVQSSTNPNLFTGVGPNDAPHFTLLIDPNTGDYNFNLIRPLDHPDTSDPNDLIIIHFDVTITDGDGDTDTSNLLICVHDDGPTARDDTDSLSRTDATARGNILVNDNIGEDGGSITHLEWDGGDVRAAAISRPDGSFEVRGNYGTLIVQANGSYTYTRKGTSGGVDNFNYVITDGDGDRSFASLDIQVSDNDVSPINISGRGATDDTIVDNNGRDVETGTINVDYQGDSPGAMRGNGDFSFGGSLEGGRLSHDGFPVRVFFEEGTNTYTGIAAGETIFTMRINANGTYRFIQHESLDHGNTSSNNEAISLRFGVTATDTDGDTGTGTVTIIARDDNPNAVNDALRVSGATGRGNVLDNDDTGADEGASIVRFNVDGQWYNISEAVDTPIGTVTINSDGSYTVTDRADPVVISETRGATQRVTRITRFGVGEDSWVGNQQFDVTEVTRTTRIDGGNIRVTYEMRDGDGDVSQARLDVRLDPIVTTRTERVSTPVNDDGWQEGGDGGGTPLVLDLDGDGIEMTSTADGVRFDMGSDGDKDLVAWVQSDDGLLARDVNQDGEINNQNELYGTLDVDGFHILAEQDDNNDGVIDANDEVFDELLVWQDYNQDGISQEGELKTLSDHGIQSISLAATMTDYDLEGSWVAYDSSFTREDGSTGQISDVWFQFIDEKNWDLLVESMGEEAAQTWLENTHSTVTQFIPSETNSDWQPGDPLVLGSTHKIFEVGLNDTIVSQDGELTVFYGGDDPGAVRGNGNFQVGGSLYNGALTSNGTAINISFDQDTGVYFGMAGDTLVFNLQVQDDGNYTFNLFDTLDHGNDVNLDDNILLQFGVTVTDAEGDSTDSAIRLQVRDSGSYLNGDTSEQGDFDVTDGTLFQAIEESADIMAGLNSAEGSDTDLSLLLEVTDDVTETIEEFVYSTSQNDSDVPVSTTGASLPEVDSDAAIVTTELPDIISDQDIII